MFGLTSKERSQKVKATADFVDLLAPRIQIVFGKCFSERVPDGTFEKVELKFEEDDDGLTENVRVLVTIEGARISRAQLSGFFEREDYTALDENVRDLVDGALSVDCRAWSVDMCGLLDEIERISDDKGVRALCRHRFTLAEQHGLTIEFLGPIEVGTA